jgi:hypothetical protein
MAAFEPEDMPPEDGVPALLRGSPVAAEVEEFEAPGAADVAGRELEVEDDEPEEDVEDEEDDEDVALAIFQPLICTPTTCVEPRTVLVSDQGPASVRV